MVFSFLKKNTKDNRPAGKKDRVRAPAPTVARTIARPLNGPVNRSLNATSMPTKGGGFATTETALPERDVARTLALQTAAKIDAIESEMSRDFLRPNERRFKDSAANSVITARGGGVPGVEVVERSLPAAPAAVAAPRAAAPRENTRPLADGDDGLGANADAYFGSVDAIEINTASAGSILDETAILFANGQPDAAEVGLRAAIEGDLLAEATETAWLMLFELVRQRGDKAGFEQLTMQYALRFEHSAPAWFDYLGAAPARAEPKPNGGPVVRLPQVIDANIVKPLEELKALAMNHTSLTLDVSGTRAIDLIGAELLLRVVNAFKRATHELVVLGADQLLVPLRAIIEPGRRDVSDAAWMLLLEVHRLLNRQADFEEVGIQYCITFEVSPPSWEPAPHNLKTRAATVAPPPGTPAPADPLDWRGEIANDGEPQFGRLLMAGKTASHLAVECAQLRRMSFSAASNLLTVVIKLQQAGAQVHFRNVNFLVGVLLRLMGVAAVAEVQLRRH